MGFKVKPIRLKSLSNKLFNARATSIETQLKAIDATKASNAGKIKGLQTQFAEIQRHNMIKSAQRNKAAMTAAKVAAVTTATAAGAKYLDDSSKNDKALNKALIKSLDNGSENKD